MSEPTKTSARCCVVCGRATRPSGASASEFPGTLVERPKRMCSKCYRDRVRVASEPEDHAYLRQDDELDVWSADPNWVPRRKPSGNKPTPNPYLCRCGYTIITHTTIQPSRHHVNAAKRHTHKCPGKQA